MRNHIDGIPYSEYDGRYSRFVRLSQIQAGPTALGSQPAAEIPTAQGTPTTQGTTTSPAKQDVLDKRNLDQYMKTLTNLETQVTEYKRMINQLEQQIIMRGQGRTV